MTVWFVSRHPGATEWAKRQGFDVDRQVEHLDVEQVAAGDTVIGTLPVHLAEGVCCRGAWYCHLILDIPPERRGRELSADEMDGMDARLAYYHVQQVKADR
ncbi:CRISPR-associated protein Csx16 [Halorhodospira halophila]|uniref:Putative CRISPR-associated protein, VVA1548 family n=1 Tax=Halorhodospira halophila (strain DSM 244 / SL1) TaxID=349124 RepID=A1WUQ7_HALHL|nr:CRISPR-associated protein Csx16 [Halorhodospira halophila]ABM61419.1 putative CRISPR-associated protein, VVA1548 family [Halorhodospira halophila SL1]MBK1728663.1 CRISPR-associated protein Csx16 [Halorhodospira halophila]